MNIQNAKTADYYLGNPNSASRAKIYPQTKMAARESGGNRWSTRIAVLQNEVASHVKQLSFRPLLLLWYAVLQFRLFY